MTFPILRCLIAASLSLPALAAGQAAATKPASGVETGVKQSSVGQVVVDVVVTDAHRNAVHNLTKADFTVLEEGHAQVISTFEEHHAWEAAAPLPEQPEVPRGTFTNYTSAPASGALHILLLDLLNTPAAARQDIRNQMLGYLKQVQPGTRIAIFGLSSHLILLQGFTSDPELLSTVIAAKQDQQRSSAANEPGDAPAAQETIVAAVRKGLGNDPGVSQVLASVQQFEAETQTVPFQLRARTTLDALNQIGRAFSSLPGRKNLIWFSGAFPINILPDGELPHSFAAVSASEDEFRETADLLSRSRVSVYPVHVAIGGVTQSAPLESDSNPNAKYIRDPVGYRQDQTRPNEQDHDDPGAMQAMADTTGGQVFASTNGLKDAVEKAIDHGSSYYTLAYSPSEQQLNGSYRKIQVDVARPGLTLAYRRGYFADDLQAAPQRDATATSTSDAAPYSALGAAMTLGGPDATQIIFTAAIAPVAGGPETDLAPDNKAADQARGPYRRYAVHLGVDMRDLNCPTTPEGAYRCMLDLSAIVYDAAGTALVSVSGPMEANMSADQYAAALRTALGFRQDISVPVGGDCFLRIGIRDQVTDKVGAVEIPISTVSNLPPAAAQPRSQDQPAAQGKEPPGDQH